MNLSLINTNIKSTRLAILEEIEIDSNKVLCDTQIISHLEKYISWVGFRIIEGIVPYDDTYQNHLRKLLNGMRQLKAALVKIILAFKRNREIIISRNIGQIFKNMDDNSGADVAAFVTAVISNNFKIIKTCLISIQSKQLKR